MDNWVPKELGVAEPSRIDVLADGRSAVDKHVWSE